jgi:hypothetical protein
VLFVAQWLHAEFDENFYFLYNIKAMDHHNINLYTRTPQASSYGEISGQNSHGAQATPLRHRAKPVSLKLKLL